jgi:hypothetical protein
MMRAVASVPPPAPQGTMSVIGRSGYAAKAMRQKSETNAAAAAARGESDGTHDGPLQEDAACSG